MEECPLWFPHLLLLVWMMKHQAGGLSGLTLTLLGGAGVPGLMTSEKQPPHLYASHSFSVKSHLFCHLHIGGVSVRVLQRVSKCLFWPLPSMNFTLFVFPQAHKTDKTHNTCMHVRMGSDHNTHHWKQHQLGCFLMSRKCFKCVCLID